MAWRFACIVLLLITISSSKISARSLPAGFARNPYGVAGSPGSLKFLSMPATSPFYDWRPREKARYITVRPYCPPRNCDGAKPWEVANYWFWDTTAKTIGHSESDRDKFRNYVNRNKGAVWIIGNEPEDSWQDNLSATEYAKMFHIYFTQVKHLDPTAKFTIASVAGIVHYREFTQMKTYYDAVFAEYKRLYGVDIPFDYWNIHAYYHGWTNDHPKTNPEMVNLVFANIIDPYLQYRQTVAGGLYKNKPILVTEIGIAAKELSLSQDQVIEYMKLSTSRLLPLVDQGTIESFFWFYGGWDDGTYVNSNLLQSDWRTPTSLGVAYAHQAHNWDRQFGLEQADFNQDKKIGILDFSGLVKVFGTNNALLSLDSDPKITRADLTIFKQVFNLASQ